MTKRSKMISNAALGALTNGTGVPAQDVGTGMVPDNILPNPFEPISDKMKNSTELCPEFTGLARSVVCAENQGFKNFQILTLFIEKGKVTRMERSDMWANFETAAILENVSHISMIDLNAHWENGKAFRK